jgi:hypothetical protein
MTDKIDRQKMFEEHASYFAAATVGRIEQRGASDTASVDFAKLAVQSLLLVHSGALFLLPTAVDKFEATYKAHPNLFWMAFGLFAFGAILALVASMVGTYAFTERYNSASEMISAAHSSSWTIVWQNLIANVEPASSKGLSPRTRERAKYIAYLKERMEEFDGEAKEHKGKADKHFKNYNRFVHWGWGLLLLSLAAFIAATILLGLAFTGQTSALPQFIPSLRFV